MKSLFRKKEAEQELETLKENYNKSLEEFKKLVKEQPDIVSFYQNHPDELNGISNDAEMMKVLLENGLDPIKSRLLAKVCNQFLIQGFYPFSLSHSREEHLLEIITPYLKYYPEYDNEKSPLVDILPVKSTKLLKVLLDLGYKMEKAKINSIPYIIKMLKERDWEGVMFALDYPIDLYVAKEEKVHIFTFLLAYDTKENQKVEMVLDKLIDKGLDFSRFHLDSLLVPSVEKGFNRFAKICLENGVNPNEQRNSKDETALMVASKKGDLPMLQELLKYGADPNLQNEEGKTAIELNPFYENFKICMTLYGLQQK